MFRRPLLVHIIFKLLTTLSNMNALVKWLRLGLCASLLLVAFAPRAETQAQAWQLLQKAAVAGHVMSYTGIFVYTNASHTKAIQVKHIYDGKGEYSRNVTLEETPRELFTEGQELVIYNRKDEKVIIKKRHAKNIFPNILPIKTQQLKAGYELHAAETSRVAGRMVRLLLLIPKDNYRYTHHFWVDQEYGMLLKYEVHDDKHKVLERVAFNQLNLVENLDLDWFRPQIDTSKQYEMEDQVMVIPDTLGAKPWRIADIPTGYRKVDQVKVHAHNRAEPMTQLIFCDGLSSVSLFIEPLNEKMQPFTGHHVKGNTSLYADVKKGHQITVVGEVPTDTVVEFGQAILFE